MMLQFRKYIKSASSKEDGYTLLELLVVLVILTLIVGIAGPQVIRQFGKAKSDTARVEMNRLITELEFFRVDVGRFPSSEEGLSALLSQPASAPGWAGPYVSRTSQTQDPWGNNYVYTITGDNPTLQTLGANGVSGGTGEDLDITTN